VKLDSILQSKVTAFSCCTLYNVDNVRLHDEPFGNVDVRVQKIIIKKTQSCLYMNGWSETWARQMHHLGFYM